MTVRTECPRSTWRRSCLSYTPPPRAHTAHCLTDRPSSAQCTRYTESAVMWRFGGLLTAALLCGAEAQDASCGRDLASISARLNDVCCAGDATDCTGGSARGPRYCSADCAALWNPFYSRCSRFVDASMPNLASFSTQCQSQSPAAGSPGATFDPDWSDGCGGAPCKRQQKLSFRCL